MNTNKRRKNGRFPLFHVLVTSIIADLFGHFIFVDAPATVNHIMAHESQFRIGFVISHSQLCFFFWRPGICTCY